MKALLRKDIYVIGKQLGLLIVLALVLCVIPVANSVGATYAIMISYMVPVTVVSYDEKCKWDKYAAMLPYTPRQIVLSKYLLSYLMVGYGFLVQLLGQMAETVLERAPASPDDLLLTAFFGVVCVLLNVVNIPLVYRVGAETSRYLTLLPLLGVFGIALFLFMSPVGNGFLDRVKELPLLMKAAAVVVVLAALSVPSFQLSVRFYVRRRNGVYG